MRKITGVCWCGAAVAAAVVATTLTGCETGKTGPARWREPSPSASTAAYYECYDDRSNPPCVAGHVLIEKDGTRHPVIPLWTESDGKKRVILE